MRILSSGPGLLAKFAASEAWIPRLRGTLVLCLHRVLSPFKLAIYLPSCNTQIDLEPQYQPLAIMPFKHELPLKPLPLQVESENGGARPNYIIFMPDQLRYDSLGCTTKGSDGSTASPIKTPNIDAFAARGSLFTNCFTQASVCSQSRCSMFTGTYPHVSGHRSLENLIKPWEPNVFRSLKG